MTSVSTSSFYDTAVLQMSALQTQENTLQAQISTGNSLQASSDDPVGAAELRVWTQQDATSKIESDNADTTQTNLNLADTALTSVTNIVQNIQTLATQAASGTQSTSDLAEIGTQVAALQANLVSLANSQDSSGHALFGGETSGAAYTVDGSGNATYVGTANAPTTALGQGLSVTAGVTGPQVFDFTSGGVATNLLAVVNTLATALQSGSGGQAAATTAITQLSDGLNQVDTAQTMVGAHLAWIGTTNTIRTALDTQRTGQETNVGSTDETAAITKLSQITTALQASQASFVKISGLSLFSIIQ